MGAARVAQRTAILGGAATVLWLASGMLGGAAAGVGVYTFHYARGASYFSNDPRACANCHVMQSYYDGWQKASHHTVAVCNDCHLPHDPIGKYVQKSRNGFNHSWAFTTGNFHEPIRIGERNLEVTEQACRYCHGEVVQAIDSHALPGGELECIRCHENVGHLH